MTETVLAPFGVQVDGLDAIELDETGVARLRTLLAEHGVRVLPGQGDGSRPSCRRSAT